MTSAHSCLKSKTSTRSRRIPPRNNKLPETAYRNILSPTALLTVTHPLIPSQEGKHTTQTSNYQTKSSISNLPSREGIEGCVTPEHGFLKSKTSTRSRRIPPRNNKLPETAHRNILSPASLLTVTHPSIPSREGKTSHSNLSLPNKKQYSNLPS